MVALRIVPDSSFFMFFLDDVGRPGELRRMLSHREFGFGTGAIIRKEVHKSRHFDAIADDFARFVEMVDYYRYGELVRPFFSFQEIQKGEHEVVVIAFIWDATAVDFHAIVDDGPVRSFIEGRFPGVWRRTMGTLGFIERCAEVHRILSRDEAIDLLRAMMASGFRIKSEIVEDAIGRLGA